MLWYLQMNNVAPSNLRTIYNSYSGYSFKGLTWNAPIFNVQLLMVFVSTKHVADLFSHIVVHE